ncbi:28S ribosomal protein S15, mitochondrial-like [Pollicipes pollicipes]|uniref:28S ribosomal protein S15, mitochondrial-like n=1 Tax=Pollicipes pollicipes TaxID=41117 RepID=UPI001884ED94|nr:28S ribosomal protein S15, mitochondrial-like [Pollicipes pollicipes]
MSIFGRLAGIRTVAPVICSSQPRRCKVVDVKDVVQWKFVEKPSPHTASYSGDLGINEPVDLTQPQFAVKPALDVLNRSDEVTQRVLSLEFARGVEKTKYLEERAVARIQRHRFDTESPEAKIARLTVKIREFQRRLMTPEGAKEGGPMRRHVHNMTWRRSGLLRQLRAADYRRFEWVLDQVEVIYRPPLPPGTDTTLTRKSGIRRMVKIFCDNIRQEKLDSLRRQAGRREAGVRARTPRRRRVDRGGGARAGPAT